MRIAKKSKSSIFKKRTLRKLGDQEALYESSVRKLGWRFTARLPSAAAHADACDHENVVLDFVRSTQVPGNFRIFFRYYIEALDRANKIEKWQCWGKVLLAWSFWKVDIFGRNLENFEKYQKFENASRGALLLYELSEREPGWRFTARCHTKTVAKRARVEPRTPVVSTMEMSF